MTSTRVNAVETDLFSSSLSSSYSLETEVVFLVFFVFSFLLLNEVTEDGFSSPVFLLFGCSLGGQPLGSLTLYRTAA
jgi:hypothetical protein